MARLLSNVVCAYAARPPASRQTTTSKLTSLNVCIVPFPQLYYGALATSAPKESF